MSELINAAIIGDVTKVKKLLADPRTNVNVTDKRANTALRWASRLGCAEIVKLLLKAGADPNKRYHSGYGNTVLMEALEPWLHGSGYAGWAPLNMGCRNDRTEIVRLLLARGADPNKRNIIGVTALMLASMDDRTEIVRLLLASGADPHIQNKYGDTALMLASRKGHTEIVRLLKRAIAARQMAPGVVGNIYKQAVEHRRGKEKDHTHCLFTGKGGNLTKTRRNIKGCENVEGRVKSFLFNKSKRKSKKKSKRKKKIIIMVVNRKKYFSNIFFVGIEKQKQ